MKQLLVVVQLDPKRLPPGQRLADYRTIHEIDLHTEGFDLTKPDNPLRTLWLRLSDPVLGWPTLLRLDGPSYLVVQFDSVAHYNEHQGVVNSAIGHSTLVPEELATAS